MVVTTMSGKSQYYIADPGPVTAQERTLPAFPLIYSSESPTLVF
jgi:hypothetical protein